MSTKASNKTTLYWTQKQSVADFLDTPLRSERLPSKFDTIWEFCNYFIPTWFVGDYRELVNRKILKIWEKSQCLW